MIAATFPRPAPATMADQLWPMVGLSLALCALALAAMQIDARLLDGTGVWAKPLKFSTSFTVYFGTLALVAGRLGPAARQGRLMRAAIAAAIIAAIGEMAYIFFMAGQAAPSHFNTSAPIYIFLYQIMGLGALLLVLSVAAVGIIAGRDRGAQMGPALRLGVAVGFPLSTLLTLITAGALSAQSGHFIGVPAPGAATLPLLGWSASVGDLRPAHFLALHAMQVLPLAGIAADRLGLAPRGVWAVAAIYTALTAAVFAQALAGLPLIRL